MFNGFVKYSVLGVAVVLMTACGGGGTSKAEENTTQRENNNSDGTVVDTVAPVFTSNNAETVAENQTSAITVTATDATAVTYAISGGDSTDFNIDASTGVISFKTAPDFEIKNTYTFTVTATDTLGNASTQEVSISVTDVDELAPVFTSNNAATVAENQTSAITLVATDTSIVSYSISGGDSSIFDVNASTGVVSFKVAPDFLTRTTYAFTVRATDAYDNVSTQEVTIIIPDRRLKKTGQTSTYSAKDDGFYQKGVTPSYTRDDTLEVVTDYAKGLQWQDNAEVKSIFKNWADAQTYCSSLSLDGGGWRLPRRKELVGLSDYGKTNSAINSVFINTMPSYYWSSTAYAGGSDMAWSVYFTYGSQDKKDKSDSCYVRCVRAGQVIY